MSLTHCSVVSNATSEGSDWARKSDEEGRDEQSAEGIEQARFEASDTKEKEDPDSWERGVRGEEGVEGREARAGVGVEGAVVMKGGAGADGTIGTAEEEGATEAEDKGGKGLEKEEEGAEVDEEEVGMKIVSSYLERTIWRSLVRRR